MLHLGRSSGLSSRLVYLWNSTMPCREQRNMGILFRTWLADSRTVQRPRLRIIVRHLMINQSSSQPTKHRIINISLRVAHLSWPFGCCKDVQRSLIRRWCEDQINGGRRCPWVGAKDMDGMGEKGPPIFKTCRGISCPRGRRGYIRLFGLFDSFSLGRLRVDRDSEWWLCSLAFRNQSTAGSSGGCRQDLSWTW